MSSGRDAARALAGAVASGRVTPSALGPGDVLELARELALRAEEQRLQREELARQQEEIERARQRYRELFERAPVGYLMLDCEGVIEDSNEAARALLGHPRPGLHQRDLASIVTPAHRELWAFTFAAAMEGHRPAAELEVVRGDGAPCAVRVEPVTLARGREEPRLLVTVSDNGPRIEAQRALRTSEAHYQQLFSVNPVPMLIAAREGLTVLAANPAAERAYGLAAAELAGRSLPGLACDDDAAALGAWLGGKGRGRCERPLQFRRRGGGALVALVSAHDVAFHGTDAVLVVVEDVTERWHAERETRRASELMRAVIAAAPMGIVCVGPRGDVRIANAAADRVLDAHCSAMEGAAFVEVARVEGLAPILLQALEGCEVPSTDLPFYPPESREAPGRSLRVRHLTVSAAPVLGEGGRVEGAIVALTDVTRRRELEDQLRQADKLRAIGQLAGGIAHDFNNLLTVILSCAAAIEEDLPPASPALADAGDIIKATHRAADLTQRLLSFSRRQPGDSSEASLDVTVRDWAESILRHWIPESIRLDVRLDARDACVQMDPTQLQQVLLNLVLNARDALPSGGTIRLLTSRDDAHEPPLAVVEVIDDGVGMTPEVRERIFEPFFTTKGPDQGTGLGLATVYGIVQQAGGEIQVDSVPGRGTRFCIAMPCTERISRPTAPPPRLSLTAGGECVLLVEDDDAVRRSLCRGLARLGFRVLEADGYERAVELARMYRDTIRVLVTDVVMPVANGFEVSREVRRFIPSVDVIFMSGYADEAIVPLGAAHEAGPILAKPFTPDDLAARIRDVLARSSLGAALAPLRAPTVGLG